MTRSLRARCTLTTLAAGSLATAALATLGTPATRCHREVFAQSKGVYLGDTGYTLVVEDERAIPAVGTAVPPRWRSRGKRRSPA